jgi:hypothetical protein
MSADGLDCTGFIGWAVFNLLPNDTGYVVKSDYMVQTYASYGWGTLIKKNDIQTRVPGDIMGKSGHAWISLGTCADGSVLILHSSPPGAQLCGTQSGSVKSDAVKLAENFTAAYYPEWNAKFPDRVRNNAYLTDYDMFRWDPEFLPDPDGIRESSPEKVLEILFEK